MQYSATIKLRGDVKLILIINRTSWISALVRLVKSPTREHSLHNLRSPPTLTGTKFKNCYIPLTRRTLFRELLQDTSVILPSEREEFEKVALSLDQKLSNQFQIIQDELSLLSQSIEPLTISSLSNTTPVGSIPNLDTTPFRPLSDSERLDQEFWLLRRISELVPVAGFTEVSRDLLEKACQAQRVPKGSGALAFVDVDQYSIIRFWIRGIHHRRLTFPDHVPPSTVGRNSGSKASLFHAVPRPSRQPKDWPKWAVTALSVLARQLISRTRVRAGRWLGSKTSTDRLTNVLHQPGGSAAQLFSDSGDLCFSRVLMAVQMKKDNSLHVKLFENVPSSGSKINQRMTNSLTQLLPQLTYAPLSGVGRLALLASCGTALATLGLVAPLTWLTSSSPDLALAWCLATAAGSGVTGCLVWARYWQARSVLSDRLRQLHYHCGHNTGSQAITSLLRLALEEQFKASLLSYALLLRPSEAGSPLSPSQLGIRAESWIAKRLTLPPRKPHHIPLPSTSESASADEPHANHLVSKLSRAVFTGGSGPLFDLEFDAQRPLDLLHRLDLVRGSQQAPMAVSVGQAASSLRGKDGSSSASFGRLWLLDSLVNEAELSRR